MDIPPLQGPLALLNEWQCLWYKHITDARLGRVDDSTFACGRALKILEFVRGQAGFPGSTKRIAFKQSLQTQLEECYIRCCYLHPYQKWWPSAKHILKVLDDAPETTAIARRQVKHYEVIQLDGVYCWKYLGDIPRNRQSANAILLG